MSSEITQRPKSTLLVRASKRAMNSRMFSQTKGGCWNTTLETFKCVGLRIAADFFIWLARNTNRRCSRRWSWTLILTSFSPWNKSVCGTKKKKSWTDWKEWRGKENPQKSHFLNELFRLINFPSTLSSTFSCKQLVKSTVWGNTLSYLDCDIMNNIYKWM